MLFIDGGDAHDRDDNAGAHGDSATRSGGGERDADCGNDHDDDDDDDAGRDSANDARGDARIDDGHEPPISARRRKRLRQLKPG